jgi:hypothetical protein
MRLEISSKKRLYLFGRICARESASDIAIAAINKKTDLSIVRLLHGSVDKPECVTMFGWVSDAQQGLSLR